MLPNRDNLGRFASLALPSVQEPLDTSSEAPFCPSSSTMSDQEENQPRTLNDYLNPTQTATPSCIMLPPNAPRIEFKPGMIQLLPTFHGLDSENPYVHIREFEEVVATFHSQPIGVDTLRLRFFPFSLKDRAKSWLYSLRPRSIGTWGEMTTAFFHKYFPHHKTNGLKREISTFSQKDSETLYQSWERFKELLSMCPHHGYEDWRLVSYFYDGLTYRERQFVEMMCNGEFLRKDPQEAIEYLNDLAEKAYTWTGPSATESTNRSKPSGVYHLREEDTLKAQVHALIRELEHLKARDGSTTRTVARAESYGTCFVCGGVDHLARDCLTFRDMRGSYEEHCNAFGTYQKPHAPYNTYNPSYHQNYNWKSEHSQPEQHMSRSYPTPTYNAPPRSNSLEDTLHAFMEAQNRTNEKFEKMFIQVAEDQKEMKSQISNLTSAVEQRGKSPMGQHLAHASTSKAQNTNSSCKAITLESELPPKLTDPGSLMIPCQIGSFSFKALCDLGSNCNIMPLSVFNRLSLGEMQHEQCSLHLADGTTRYPMGKVEAMVGIDRFTLPAEFVILDTEEDSVCPIIMGRPFFAAGGTIVDVKEGVVTMQIDDTEVAIRAFDPPTVLLPTVEETPELSVALIQSYFEEYAQHSHQGGLSRAYLATLKPP